MVPDRAFSRIELGVIALLAFMSAASSNVARFDNYKVYQLLPVTDRQIDALQKIQNGNYGYDFWKETTYKNESVEVMVPPHKDSEFSEFLERLNIHAIPFIEDVQSLIDGVSERALNDGFDWNDYYRLYVIYSWLHQLEATYPEVIKVIEVGRSFEERPIKGVKLSFKARNRAVFLEGGIHAREWISVSTVTFILNELLTSKDPNVRKVAASYDWYIFPVVNPDGYEYSFLYNRLWRKTRKPYGLCVGADPNRNWNFHWGEGGTSTDPCADNYAGTAAFSEPETRSLSQFITRIQRDLIGYIGFHSYSQCLLVPYGYTNQHLDNYDELITIGKKAVTTLEKRYGTKYKVGNTAETIYVASGGSMDWVKGKYKIPITYTYELRDTGRYGFLLPRNLIVPTAEETFDSLITIMKEAKDLGY